MRRIVVSAAAATTLLAFASVHGFTHSSEYFQLIRRYFGQDAEQMVRLSRGQG